MPWNQKPRLTATDYYKANQPEYMKENPEIRNALIRIQSNCKPRECVECMFFRWNFKGEEMEAECSIGNITYVYDGIHGKRAAECPLDTGRFRDDEELSETADQKHGGRADERTTGGKTGGGED